MEGFDSVAEKTTFRSHHDARGLRPSPTHDKVAKRKGPRTSQKPYWHNVILINN